MRKRKFKKAGSIIEVVIAMAFLVVIITEVFGLYITGIRAATFSDMRFQAEMYLQEGFEAVRSIRNYDFNNLTIGNHGLDDSGGYWTFSGTEDQKDVFTRTVSIANVQRNLSCAIVDSGGNIDPDSRNVAITIEWTENGEANSLSASQYLHNWENPSLCSQQSDWLIIDVSGVYEHSINKKIVGITLENTGPQNLTIDKINMVWSADSLVERFRINELDIWNYVNAGSPSGMQPSGTELDVTDYIIPPSEIHEIGEIKFNGKMDGSSFTLTVIFSDGSSSSVFLTLPEE